MIGPGSRYAGLAPLTYTTPEGEVIPYLPRRAIPSGTGTLLGAYTTRKGERLDLVAARTMGNALLFWELADANHLLDPLEIPSQPDTRLLIYLPTAKART